MTDDDIRRLPKWAQQEIQRLRTDKAFLKEQIKQMSGDKPSDIQWSANYTEWHNIPSGSSIRIHSDVGGYIEIQKTFKGKLTILAQGVLVLKPGGGVNSIFVESEEY